MVGVITAILIAGCEKKDDYDSECTCDVEKPEVNLERLKSRLELRLCCEVYSIRYRFKKYITIVDCPETRDGMGVIFDCKGTQICAWGGMNPGSYPCNPPTGFTGKYYEQYKRLLYKQDITIK